MSVVAEFTIPPRELPAGNQLVANPKVEIELERIVPTEESTIPFFWIWGPDPESFVEDVVRDSALVSANLLDSVDDGALYRAEWKPGTELIQAIRSLDPTIVEATGTGDGWLFEVRANERGDFRNFQEVFERHGIRVELNRLYDLSDTVDGGGQKLTSDQRETLLTAYQEGYFEKPRRVTQEELSEHFDVSSRAISDRLRRANRNLIATTLLPSGKQ